MSQHSPLEYAHSQGHPFILTCGSWTLMRCLLFVWPLRQLQSLRTGEETMRGRASRLPLGWKKRYTVRKERIFILSLATMLTLESYWEAGGIYHVCTAHSSLQTMTASIPSCFSLSIPWLSSTFAGQRNRGSHRSVSKNLIISEAGGRAGTSMPSSESHRDLDGGQQISNHMHFIEERARLRNTEGPASGGRAEIPLPG